jgi:hypothetical protein
VVPASTPATERGAATAPVTAPEAAPPSTQRGRAARAAQDAADERAGRATDANDGAAEGFVTGPFLKGISSDTNVTRLVRYFKRHEAYLEPTLLQSRALRGDYIAYNWKGKGGALDHSGMFLAWDHSATPAVAWTLESNIGNSVVIKERPISEMDGFGRISGIDLPNRPACEEWCRNDERRAKCSQLPGCGLGYEPLKSWTGAGANYYACREREGSRDNHEECNTWCAARADCAKCSTELNCGLGYERVASFTTNGTNWYACREAARSRGDHEACLEWCGAHSECDRCSTRLGCGIGYRQIRNWTSGGTNWYACAER